uniref:Cadherin domain-containing protein n=1 Tax=Timema poppense TaxID=170557 RepID=A0A7R9GXS5_TIMPO|nr:unnamed protein product [Timema poppensis]
MHTFGWPPNLLQLVVNVIAEELSTDPRLSSTATVTVSIADANDNFPKFYQDGYTATVSETASPGTVVTTITATDRDGGDFGENGIIYQLSGNGAENFKVNNKTGVITVAVCPTPGTGNCLDFETKPIYYLNYKAMDDNGKGHSTVVPLMIQVIDANDNPPQFLSQNYKVTIDEGATKFDPPLRVQARDPDKSSEITYYILEGNINNLFAIDMHSGEITVVNALGLDMTNVSSDIIYLVVEAKDEKFSSTATVNISVRDVNNNQPLFTRESYVASIQEDTPVGTSVEQTQATDADSGVNADLSYVIQKGGYEDFSIDNETGLVKVASNLDYDRRNIYNIEIIAVDHGIPSLTGTTTLTVNVVNSNDKDPYFLPPTQRAEVSEDAATGTVFYTLNAKDPDINDTEVLHFAAIDPITAVDKNGKQVEHTEDFKVLICTLNPRSYSPQGNVRFFSVDQETGEVSVAEPLQREIAAIVRLTVLVTDTSAPNTQQGTDEEERILEVIYLHLCEKKVENHFEKTTLNTPDRDSNLDLLVIISLIYCEDSAFDNAATEAGILVVTIVDVNDYPPVFSKPWTSQDPSYTVEILEEQPIGSVVDTFTATDPDSNIEYYAIEPDSDFFEVHNTTGVVRTKKRIDYEKMKTLNFTIVAYDSGKPQKSASADVTVNIINVNDMDPVFSQSSYDAEVLENSPAGTHVVTVTATDADEGRIGQVMYSLVGEHSSEFTVGHDSGEVLVSNPSFLDRETTAEITIQVMASDGAPADTRRTVSVPVHIRILDVNDNPPVFVHHNYHASIVENIVVSPPSPIVQVLADDIDQGINGAVRYSIVSGNQGDVFKLIEETGILYPAKSLVGQPREFHLVVQARDGDGNGQFYDQAAVDLDVLDVNLNKPIFIMPAHPNATVEVPENAGLPNYLVMTVKAVDKDTGDNGRVSYHLKVGNENQQETEEFSINHDTGELRTKIILDREIRAKYELLLVAKDHGSPTSYETLHFLTVLLVDTDDNIPQFPVDGTTHPYRFRLSENLPGQQFVGRVEAVDHDEGKHAVIYYYILLGNGDNQFYINKLDGSLYANQTFDREKKGEYELYIKASNDPNYYLTKEEKEDLNELDEDKSVAHVIITILDENDNPPKFERQNYYAGVNAMANINEFVAKLSAIDPDLGDNGTLMYYIAASNLFKYGSNRSSGSIIPSPFNVSENGKLVTANYMAEYNQDRFILDIIAKEKSYPERQAITRVHVWIYEPQQLIRVILSRPPEEVNQERDMIVAELSNVTNSLIVVDDIRYHVDAGGNIHRDCANSNLCLMELDLTTRTLLDELQDETGLCDMYLHVVDGPSQAITNIPEVLRVIDANYDFLKDYYAGFAIENVVPAFVGMREEAFDPALAALIALLIVLFVGCITFIVVCCCLRHWIITPPSDLKKKEALIKKDVLEDLNTTENPLWIEQKLKLYEEQELTMQVFCEPETLTTTVPQNDLERRDSADFSQGDYATLSGGGNLHHNNSTHSSVRGVPRDMYEASMGFQGSTFQVPLGTTESGTDPFRPRTALTINKDGQPEFVAELI